MTKAYIVTGTDTDIGKTVFAAGLVQWLGASYWKPVQAGMEEGGDSAMVAALASVAPAKILPEAYRLNTPCSPHQAAQIDGVKIDATNLALPCCDGALVMEGAGGALVPLSDELLFADMFANWKLPVILVARTTLGTINHSLLSIEALRSRGIRIHGIAFIGAENIESERAITAIGKVQHLGRLPMIDPLNSATLKASFAANIRTDLL